MHSDLENCAYLSKNPGYAAGGSKGFPLRVAILVKMAHSTKMANICQSLYKSGACSNRRF